MDSAVIVNFGRGMTWWSVDDTVPVAYGISFRLILRGSGRCCSMPNDSGARRCPVLVPVRGNSVVRRVRHYLGLLEPIFGTKVALLVRTFAKIASFGTRPHHASTATLAAHFTTASRLHCTLASISARHTSARLRQSNAQLEAFAAKVLLGIGYGYVLSAQ